MRRNGARGFDGAAAYRRALLIVAASVRRQVRQRRSAV
jgi:hypothetical protein